MRNLRLRLLVLAVLASVLLAISLPNELLHYGNPATGFICLVPFFLLVTLVPTRRFAVLVGALFGATQSLLANFWLAFFHGFSVWTVSGVALGMALYFMLFTPFFYALARLSPRYRPFVFAAAWTVYEYIKSIGFLAFPWGLVAFPVGSLLPFVQISDITGVWGVSYVMALISALGAETLRAAAGFSEAEGALYGRPASAQRRLPLLQGWATAALFVAGMLGYGFATMAHPLPVKDTLRAVLVQQNIDSWLAGPAVEQEILTTGEKLSRAGIAHSSGPVDLVVWSEESLLRPYLYDHTFYEHEPPSDPFVHFLSQIDTPLLVGAPYVLSVRKQQVMNATILLDPNGKLLDYYGKRRLVPFAEYIPFWNVPIVQWFMENVIGIGGGWTPGERNTIFTLKLHTGATVRFGTPICFEDSFPDIARGFFLAGADLLINLTNTSWSDTVSAETQQFTAARFLSIENKRVMIRSTNSGVTSVIGPYGRVLASLPLFTPASLPVDVPIYESNHFTPYTLYGDYLPELLAVVVLLCLLKLAGFPAILRRRRGSAHAPDSPADAESETSRE